MWNYCDVNKYYGIKNVIDDLRWLGKTCISYSDKKMTLAERAAIDYWFATDRARLGTELALIYKHEQDWLELHGDTKKVMNNYRKQEKRLAFVIGMYYRFAKRLNKLDNVYSCWNGVLGINALYPNEVEPLTD